MSISLQRSEQKGRQRFDGENSVLRLQIGQSTIGPGMANLSEIAQRQFEFDVAVEWSWSQIAALGSEADPEHVLVG